MSNDPARDFCKCGHRRVLHPNDQACTSLNCACKSEGPRQFTFSQVFNRPKRDGSQP